MIQFVNARTRGAEPPFDPLLVNRTPKEAFESFVLYELAYGARVLEVDDQKVKCVTHVMSCVDTTTITGHVDEMKHIVEAAALAVYFANEHREAIIEGVSMCAMRITRGNPLLLKMGAGIMLGDSTTKMVLLGMLGNLEHVKACEKLPVKDLFAVVSMSRYEGVSVEDAIGLALA